jgi:hypothetical protein
VLIGRPVGVSGQQVDGHAAVVALAPRQFVHAFRAQTVRTTLLGGTTLTVGTRFTVAVTVTVAVATARHWAALTVCLPLSVVVRWWSLCLCVLLVQAEASDSSAVSG